MIKSTMQGLLVAATALGSSAGAIADDEDGGHLHGVWRITRTPINCQSGQQVAPSFQAVMIFNEDGTLTGYGVPPASSPALQSPEFGLWKLERDQANYSFRDLSYTYDAAAASAVRVELTAHVQLAAGGDTLTHETI